MPVNSNAKSHSSQRNQRNQDTPEETAGIAAANLTETPTNQKTSDIKQQRKDSNAGRPNPKTKETILQRRCV
jgi:hypothetical protein